MNGVSWEDFGKYLKTGIAIYATDFVSYKAVENWGAEIKYYRNFGEYKRDYPKSMARPESYENHFGSLENIEKILVREPVRLMKNVPQLKSVKIYAPYKEKYHISYITRPQAESFFKISLKALGESNNRWIKFVDKFAGNEINRIIFVKKFVKIEN